MEIVADIIAGLGLFFIGVRSIGTHMKQMTGARFRSWVAWATGHHLSAALVGTAAGIVTQSSNAVTFISVSLVTSGMITPARALPVLAWANVGTALLVFLATLDIHIAVLFLLGVVGFCYYFGLNERERGRHLIGALYGVGMLFFGVWLIKQGARPMKDLESVRAFIRFSAQSQLLPFIAGLLLTLVIQSSSTMSAIAVTMAALSNDYPPTHLHVLFHCCMAPLVRTAPSAMSCRPSGCHLSDRQRPPLGSPSISQLLKRLPREPGSPPQQPSLCPTPHSENLGPPEFLMPS